MDRSFAPQQVDGQLAEHPHRFILCGEPGGLAMPPLCPNCGEAAADRVTVEKVFRRRSSEASDSYLIVPVALPLCAGCAVRHRAGTVQPTRWQRVLSSFSNADMLGAVLPAIAALFVLQLALRDLLNGRLLRSTLPFALAAVFAAIAWYQRKHVWAETAHLRVPQQSEVARAFDFSDDVAPAFEQPRFICTMKDGRFATAFAALNADRLYRPDSTEARGEQRRAKRQLRVVLVLLAIAALAMVLFGS